MLIAKTINIHIKSLSASIQKILRNFLRNENIKITLRKKNCPDQSNGSFYQGWINILFNRFQNQKCIGIGDLIKGYKQLTNVTQMDIYTMVITEEISPNLLTYRQISALFLPLKWRWYSVRVGLIISKDCIKGVLNKKMLH